MRELVFWFFSAAAIGSAFLCITRRSAVASALWLVSTLFDLAAIFVLQGLSPGAALAFLLTGPATNVTTFGVLKDLHGRGTALMFTAAMFAGAILLGYGVNGLLPADLEPPVAAALSHDHVSPFAVVCLVALGLLVLGSLLRRGTRGYLESLIAIPPLTCFRPLHRNSTSY